MSWYRKQQNVSTARAREMKAKFSSTCAGCNSIIKKGEDIIYDPNNRKAYHKECGQDIKRGLDAERSMEMYGTDIY